MKASEKIRILTRTLVSVSVYFCFIALPIIFSSLA